MSKWCTLNDIDAGECLINLDNINLIRKSFLCDKQPTLDFVGMEDYVSIFETEEERDNFYDKLRIKLEE